MFEQREQLQLAQALALFTRATRAICAGMPLLTTEQSDHLQSSVAAGCLDRVRMTHRSQHRDDDHRAQAVSIDSGTPMCTLREAAAGSATSITKPPSTLVALSGSRPVSRNTMPMTRQVEIRPICCMVAPLLMRAIANGAQCGRHPHN